MCLAVTGFELLFLQLKELQTEQVESEDKISSMKSEMRELVLQKGLWVR